MCPCEGTTICGYHRDQINEGLDYAEKLRRDNGGPTAESVLILYGLNLEHGADRVLGVMAEREAVSA